MGSVLKNHLSVGCRLKNQDELSTLVEVLTPEALIFYKRVVHFNG